MEENKTQRKIGPTDEEIKEWAEGNSHLEALLLGCRENDVPSMYCCAGHGMFDSAYVTMKMNSQTASKIYGIMAATAELKNVEFRFAQEEFGFKPNFTIYINGNERKRNQTMDIISSAMGRAAEIEQLPVNLQKIIKISQILKGCQCAFDLNYTNGRSKMLLLENLRFVSGNILDRQSLETMGFKARSQNPFNKSTQYSITGIIGRAKENAVLDGIINGMSSVFYRGKTTQENGDVKPKKGISKKIREFFASFTTKKPKLLPPGETTHTTENRRKKFVEELSGYTTEDTAPKTETHIEQIQINNPLETNLDSEEPTH